MNHELYEEAIHSDVLSEKLISQLLESMEYSSISFINWSIEVLKLILVRIERGDKIKDEVSGEIYTKKSFHAFVKKHFSSYIESQVFADPAKAEKFIFHSNHVKTVNTIWLWQNLPKRKSMNGFPL